QRINPHEPLQAGDPRLDLGLASVALADRVDVGPFLGYDQTQTAELLAHPRPRLVAIEAAKRLRRGVGDARLGRQDVQHGQAVALADLEVGRVVRGRDLDRARPEVRIDG